MNSEKSAIHGEGLGRKWCSLSKCIAIFFAAFVLIFALANFIFAKFDLPNYGGWTGNLPLEEKLKQLHEFATKGPVDELPLKFSLPMVT